MDFGVGCRVGKFEFDDFADADASHAGEAEVADGFRGGGALRVENGWFRQNGYEDFHGAEVFVSDGFEQDDFLFFLMWFSEMARARRLTARQEMEKTSP